MLAGELRMDVTAWLRSLGLEQYEQAFRDNAIEPDLLPTLTAEDLKELGVSLVGHRRKLLDAIAALRRTTMESADDSERGRTSAAAPVDAIGERRQVTVLFADLSGSTAFGQQLDAEEVHALLEQFYDRADRVIQQHDGHIVSHIGDCVMAVFGAPVAHDNDAERAAHAALAIQAAIPEVSAQVGRPVGVHIGLAGGQVVASRTGSANYSEYTVTGNAANLASRLTDAAASGEIFVSDETHTALAERFDCAAAGALTVKGFAEPVRAWRLCGLRPAACERRPFVGRHGEFALFRAALTTCRETRRGQVLYVRGEAGIGKTRLIEEVQRAATEVGFACHVALVLDFGSRTGRDAIGTLGRSLLGLEVTSDAEAARAANAAALSSDLLARDDAVFLHDMLDLPQPPELRVSTRRWTRPATPDDARALAQVLVAANTTFAERCVERAAGNPLFLEQLLTHADESQATAVPSSVQSLVQARIDRLAPMDKAAIQAASVLGQRFARAALAHLLDRADYAPEPLVSRLLVRPQQASGDVFLFAHALIRDAVYDTLLKSR
jgi:class 3 adenylate cyclase